jgi:hypothetical protein
MAVDREFRKIVELPTVLLYRDDLLRLEKTLKEDVNWEPDNFRISVTFENCTYPAKSFDELLQQDLPEQTDRMEVNVVGWTKDRKDINCGVTLSLHYNCADYQIHSKDEGWYLAKSKALNAFFKRRKPWYAFLDKLTPFGGGLLVGASITGISLALSRGYFLLSLAPITALILSAVFSWLSLKEKVFPHVLIKFSDRPKRRIDRDLVMLLLVFLTLIATVVGIIVPLVQD